jgi:hypothetical protein
MLKSLGTHKWPIAVAEHVVHSNFWQVLLEQGLYPYYLCRVHGLRYQEYPRRGKFRSGSCRIVSVILHSCSRTRQDLCVMASSTFRLNIRGQMSVYRESFRINEKLFSMLVTGSNEIHTAKSWCFLAQANRGNLLWVYASPFYSYQNTSDCRKEYSLTILLCHILTLLSKRVRVKDT